MPETPITLIKGDKVRVETDYGDALPVNMYAVKKDILGAQGYMIMYPGLTQLGTGSGVDRGAVYNDRLSDQYRVSGTNLISVSATGTAVVLGTIPGTSQARLQDFYSFNTQGIIADGKFFLYDSVAGFREVTDADLGSPIDGVWVDGYYFMTDGDYIFHTDLNDETSIDPLKYATAEFMPDKSLGLAKTQDNKVLVFGRYSLEYFVNAATENFAFSRVQTRAQKIGIVATHAKCESDGQFFITGGYKNSSVAVYHVGIGTSTKVSTREVDKVISEYTEAELADIRMEARTENNVNFVLIHLPDETLCFNATIAKDFGIDVAWSILKSDIETDITYRGINGIFDPRNVKWVCGDKIDTTVGVLDNTVATHYGDSVEWILYSPLINMEKFSIDEIQIETVPGFTSEDDATVAVSLTYDGITYSTEHWILYGLPSTYGQRFIARRLGIVDDWVGFKFRGAYTSRMAFGLMRLTYS